MGATVSRGAPCRGDGGRAARYLTIDEALERFSAHQGHSGGSSSSSASLSCSSRCVGSIHSVRWTRIGRPVRTPGSTTSTARSAAATGAARAGDRDGGARSDPEDGTFARLGLARGNPAGASSRCPTRWRTTCGLPPAAADGSERAWILVRLRPRAPIPTRRSSGRTRPTALRDPEATVVTVRALAGLAALNVAYAVVGLSLLWGRSRFARGAACSGSPGSGYLLGLAAFGVLWTALLVAGVPFGAVGVVLSLVVLTAAGLVAGRLRGAGFDGGRPHLGAGPILLVSAASVALAGAVPRGPVPDGAPSSCRSTTPGPSGCRRAWRSSSSTAWTRTSSRPRRTRRTAAAARP